MEACRGFDKKIYV